MSKASQIRQKAQEHLGKGQIEKAIQEYRRLISIESKNPNLYNELGDIYLRANDKDQAVLNFEKAAVIYEKVALYNNAVAVCKKILRVNSEKTETMMKLAELRAKQKLEGEAAAFFGQFVDGIIASPQTLQRAQKDVQRMLELMPGSEAILERAAEVYEQLGMKIKTAEICSRIASAASNRGDAKKQAKYRRKVEELKADLNPEEAAELREFEASQASEQEEQPAVSGPARDEASLDTPASAADAASDAPKERTTPAAESEDDGEAPADGEAPGEPETEQEFDEAEMLAAMSQGRSVPPRPPERRAAAEPPRESHAEEYREASAHPTERSVPPPERPSPQHDDLRRPPEWAEREQSQRQSERSQPAPERREAPARTDERFPTQAERPAARPRAPFPPDSSARDGSETSEFVEEITSDVEKDDLRSHYDLGMAYLEMGLYTESIRDFQIASRCAELQLSSLEMIGYCFLKAGEPRLAVKQLQRALDIASGTGADCLGIHYNMGLAYEMLGEQGRAREHFEEVYIVDMSFRDVAEKMKKMSPVS